MFWFLKQKNKRKMNQGGFTLVEMMVSLTLFVVVVLAAVSSLYSVNNASRKVEAMRVVLDNLNFAMESMSRTIRTGEGYVCEGLDNSGGTNNCPFDSTNGSYRILVNSTLGSDQEIEYRWSTDSEGRGQVLKRSRTAGDPWPDAWVSITAPEIDVRQFKFYVSGADSDDSEQPNVAIFIQGVARAGEENTAPFAVQTLISQRASE